LFSNGEEFNERDTANPLSARQAEHDPNFMLSLARGLEVLNAFTPQRQRLTISQLSQKTQISRRRPPLPVYPRRAGHGAQPGRTQL
jgi:hypothetical protein